MESTNSDEESPIDNGDTIFHQFSRLLSSIANTFQNNSIETSANRPTGNQANLRDYTRQRRSQRYAPYTRTHISSNTVVLAAPIRPRYSHLSIDDVDISDRIVSNTEVLLDESIITISSESNNESLNVSWSLDDEIAVPDIEEEYGSGDSLEQSIISVGDSIESNTSVTANAPSSPGLSVYVLSDDSGDEANNEAQNVANNDSEDNSYDSNSVVEETDENNSASDNDSFTVVENVAEHCSEVIDETSSEDDEKQHLTFMCSLCLGSYLRKEPTASVCGHVFCKTCINRSLQYKRKCPVCKKKLTARKLFRIYF